MRKSGKWKNQENSLQSKIRDLRVYPWVLRVVKLLNDPVEYIHVYIYIPMSI